MAKQSGIGARFLLAGYDLSGDVSALDTVGGTVGLLDVTDITQSAHSRISGLRDGTMSFTSFWNDANSTPVLDTLPTSDVLASFFVPTLALGAPVACLNAKQVDYDPTRANSGELTMKTQLSGQGYGIEWCIALTAGVRTDTEATDGDAFDNGAASDYGAQAYLQLTAFTGTSVTVTIEHSSDNSTWTSLVAFTEATAAPYAQRTSVSNTTTVNEYLRVSTTGTFTNAEFAVAINVNPVAGVVF